MTAETEQTSAAEIARQIVKQFEFYFSDANLARDKFMQEQIAADSFVDLSVLASFKRVQAMTTDLEVIKSALVDSTTLELNEDKSRVHRIVPFVKDQYAGKVAVCKNIPKESSLDDLIAFFAAEDAKVQLVRRSVKDNVFSGVAFLEFANEADMKAALARSFKFQDVDLSMHESKPRPAKETEEEKEAKKAAEKATLRACYLAISLEKVAAESEVVEVPAVEAESPVVEVPAASDVAETAADSEDKTVEEPKEEVKKEKENWKAIKEALAKFGKVGHVSVEKGFIRFAEPIAEAVLEKSATEPTIVGAHQIKLARLSDDDFEVVAAEFSDAQKAGKKRSVGGGGKKNFSHKKQRR